VEEWERLPLWASQRQLPNATRQRLCAQRLRNRPQGLAASLRGMGTGVQPSLWEELPQLALPTLLITGALDAKFTQIARAMGERCPACRISTIANAGHTPHLEQPEAFLDQVYTFLTKR
jgi:2-succinyl-6-hydroxy-2,4-cyclohexadiene-1-carboxylate synthase